MQSSSKLSDKAVQKLLTKLAPVLNSGENVRYVGMCINIRPALSHFLITDTRVIGVEQASVRFAHHGSEIERIDYDPVKGRITLAARGAEPFTMKSVPQPDFMAIEENFRNLQARTGTSSAPAPAAAPSTPTAAAPPAAPAPPAGPPVAPVAAAPPSTSTSTVPAGQQHCGGSLSGAAQRAIAEVSHGGETPWLILNPSGATGLLVAFEDRLAIIKTGVLTGFMAGSMFGGRQAVIYFVDINGIEFNAGMMNGVLEVLTASYQGSANKDFWQGTLSSRNANANDPFTLSNTLPMLKSEYRDWQEHINELRSRIAAAKRPAAAPMSAPAAQDSFADQVAKLAQLRADGLLSDEEFTAAKQKLMDS